MQEESVRLALLERGQENTEKEMATLREAISEISKVNVRISELLAVHQVKIEQQFKRDEDINEKVEKGIKGLTLKMEKDKNEVFKKIQELRDKVFIGVGIVLILNVLIIAVPPIIGLFGKGGLTNPAGYARVEKP